MMGHARYWHRVHHRDVRALALADRHYSRQSPGSPEFTPPGNKIVLMQFGPDGEPWALWASHRPDPHAGAVRSDGRDVWACSLFRIEHRTAAASDLIREAVAITRAVWTDVLPRDGFYTTINPRFVQPIRRRGADLWGYCYLRAGWQLLPERTKERDLIILTLPLPQLLAVAPVAYSWHVPLFGAVSSCGAGRAPGGQAG